MSWQCVAGCPSRGLRLQTTARCQSLGSASHVANSFQLRARPFLARAQRSRSLQQQTRAVLNVDQSSFETEVVKEYGAALKVVKIEADGNPDLVEKYKVYGLPTVMIFRDGKKVDASHNEGAITLPKLKAYLEKHGIAAAAAAAS